MSERCPRIHWVSPLPHAETDIAHYTRRILPELTERAHVTLWTEDMAWDRGLEKFCQIRHLKPDEILPGTMGTSDPPGQSPGTTFVNIGNSWVFHANLLTLIKRVPSVIVLHDLAIQEMLLDAIHNRLLDRDAYLHSMRHWYGEEAQALSQKALEGTFPASKLGQEFPGFELVIENAAAVLTHTPAAFEAVAARKYVPVYNLELPFQADSPAISRRSMTGPLRLVQFGYIGPNRRLEQVLEALAGMGNDFDFVLDIAGKLWNPELLKARCDALGLTQKVRLHGFIPELELDTLIGQAHLVFNLRHPTMGEASGSQLRIWNAAAASVVTDQGWYHNLPTDCVFHISLEDEISQLKSLLGRLAENRNLGQSIGQAGYARLIGHHDPAKYADGILDVAQAFEKDARDALFAESARRLLAQGQDASGLQHQRVAQVL